MFLYFRPMREQDSSSSNRHRHKHRYQRVMLGIDSLPETEAYCKLDTILTPNDAFRYETMIVLRPDMTDENRSHTFQYCNTDVCYVIC